MVVASMHGKELVMKPLLKQYLQVDAMTVPGLDTDEFGTFSGEVPRRHDPVHTLRLKIHKALELTGQTLGIGSEGSFGPHPHLPFIAADQEWVMLVDLEHNLEIMDMCLSTETNFAVQEVSGLEDLRDFANRVSFPSHGIILREVQQPGAMVKGIVSWEQLQGAYVALQGKGKQIQAETDMRACFNPQRMRVIETATTALMKRVISLCPQCQRPGFGVTSVQGGRPCGQCGTPTDLAWTRIYSCSHCQHEDHRRVTDAAASPQYCYQCNP